MVAGIVLQMVLHGWRGLLLGAGGGLLFGGVLMLFHLVRAMGAGDVKLATALGCMAGLAGTPQLMFATAVAGGAPCRGFLASCGGRSRRPRERVSGAAFSRPHRALTPPPPNLLQPRAGLHACSG